MKLIVVKERRAIAEERKANALERIAATSEKKNWFVINLNKNL